MWLPAPLAAGRRPFYRLFYAPACPRRGRGRRSPLTRCWWWGGLHCGLRVAQKAVFTGSLIQLFVDEHNLGNLSAPKKGYVDTSRVPGCRPGMLYNAVGAASVFDRGAMHRAPKRRTARGGARVMAPLRLASRTPAAQPGFKPRAWRTLWTRADAFEPSRMVVGHHPMPADLANSGRGAAMFRRPVGRLISAYNHDLHAFHMPWRQRKKMLKNTHSSLEFARWPGVAGCQTKVSLASPSAAVAERVAGVC